MRSNFNLSASYVLIAINVIISMIALASPEIFNALLLQVGAVREGEYYRLLTSGFLHGSLTHLLFNMFSLFFFGPALESRRFLGVERFLIVYFVALVAGSLYAVYANYDDPYYAAVGASGAISGILVGVSLFAPFSMILIFGIIPIPAIVFTILFIAYSAFAMSGSHSQISHEAHLGGALAGLVMTIILRPDVVGNLFGKFAALFSRRR